MHFCHQNIVAQWGLLCVTTIRRHRKTERWAARLTETLQSGRTLCYKPTADVLSATREAHNLVRFITTSYHNNFFCLFFSNQHVWNRKLSGSFLDDVFAAVWLQPNVKILTDSSFLNLVFHTVVFVFRSDALPSRPSIQTGFLLSWRKSKKQKKQPTHRITTIIETPLLSFERPRAQTPTECVFPQCCHIPLSSHLHPWGRGRQTVCCRPAGSKQPQKPSKGRLGVLYNPALQSHGSVEIRRVFSAFSRLPAGPLGAPPTTGVWAAQPERRPLGGASWRGRSQWLNF